MSTKSDTAITVVSTAVANGGVPEELSIVRPHSALAQSLAEAGAVLTTPAGQRAAAKAVSGLARDLMEGAMLLAADAGHDGARRGVACLVRVRAERAIRK